jgi:integrase
MLRRIERRTGIKCSAHKWRHTFCTLWVAAHLRRGEAFDMEELRRIMGHANYALFPVDINLAKDMVRKGSERYLPY